MGTPQSTLSSNDSEITTVVTRHVKPGRDEDYSKWFGRMIQIVRRFPGYRGITVVVPPGTDKDLRIVVYRFADRTSLDGWGASPERKQLLKEVEDYSTQVYNKATGLETWFELPNTHSIVPPPKWKMALVTFFAAGLVSYFSHLFLGAYLAAIPLEFSTVLYTGILVLLLTYFLMPNLSKLLRKWLYPAAVNTSRGGRPVSSRRATLIEESAARRPEVT